MLECPYVTTLTITHINWPLSKLCPRYCSLKPNPPRPTAVDRPISIRIVNPQLQVHLSLHLTKHLLLVVMLSSPFTLSLTPFSFKLIEWRVFTGYFYFYISPFTPQPRVICFLSSVCHNVPKGKMEKEWKNTNIRFRIRFPALNRRISSWE